MGWNDRRRAAEEKKMSGWLAFFGRNKREKNNAKKKVTAAISKIFFLFQIAVSKEENDNHSFIVFSYVLYEWDGKVHAEKPAVVNTKVLVNLTSTVRKKIE